MRVEQQRANVFTLTMTAQELSLLIASGRMALEAMRADAAPAEATALLARVLADFDSALLRRDSAVARPACYEIDVTVDRGHEQHELPASVPLPTGGIDSRRPVPAAD